MMLLAATSGSAAAGGAVMALFVLGTAPMFAAYGFVTQRYVNPDSRGMSVALGASWSSSWACSRSTPA